MSDLRVVASPCDQHAGDRSDTHGSAATSARTATPVQERRWLHPAWIATEGVVRNLARRAVGAHDALSDWAARIGIARPTLSRLLESPQGLLVGDLALLPAHVLIEVLDAWRAEIARTGALHVSIHELVARVSTEHADVVAAALRKADVEVVVREIDEAITALQALRARVSSAP